MQCSPIPIATVSFRRPRCFTDSTEAARNIQPKLIGLDASADIFAGDENNRSQVRQFIGLLRDMAIRANAAVIIVAHPSLTGINSGTGLSGSTAWHNSVRARAYLRPTKTEDSAEPDQTLRQLDFMKSNYGPTAETVTLRWHKNVFTPEFKPGSLEKLAADAKAPVVFLQLLDRFNRQGRTAGDKKGAFVCASTVRQGTRSQRGRAAKRKSRRSHAALVCRQQNPPRKLRQTLASQLETRFRTAAKAVGMSPYIKRASPRRSRVFHRTSSVSLSPHTPRVCDTAHGLEALARSQVVGGQVGRLNCGSAELPLAPA